MTITMDGVSEQIAGFRCVYENDDGTTSIGADGGPWVSGESFNFTLYTTPGGMKMELWEMYSSGDEDRRMVDVAFSCAA